MRLNSTQRQVIADKILAKIMLSNILEVEKAVKPFDGQKITLKSGGLTKKFADAKNILTTQDGRIDGYNYRMHNHFITKDYNSLYYECRISITWETYPESTYKSDDMGYYKLASCIGYLANGTEPLKVYDFSDTIESYKRYINIDYTFIAEQLEKREALLEQVKDIENTIPYYSYK